MAIINIPRLTPADNAFGKLFEGITGIPAALGTTIEDDDASSDDSSDDYEEYDASSDDSSDNE